MLTNISHLSLAVARAEFKLKNEGSYLGILWYLLNPLLMFLLLLGIFSYSLGQSIERYPLYLLVGIILFNLFRTITVEATKTIYQNRLIIKSVAFPLENLIAALVLKNLYSHIFEFIVLFGFLLFYKISLTYILFYPLLVVLICLFSYGIALCLSALAVFVMDLDNIWTFGVQLLWFATPIFYTIDEHPVLFACNLLNPMYYFITVGRELLIYNTLPSFWLILGALIHTVVWFLLGIKLFKKFQNKFAELI